MNDPGNLGTSPHRLTIPADLSHVARARTWLGEIARSIFLSEGREFDLQVATSEAVANGIEHAVSEVEIVVWTLPDRLIVEITNDGVFQPGLVKSGDTRRRGLGLPLMVSLADQVHVSRLDTDKTEVSLTFFLDAHGTQHASETAASSKWREGGVKGELPPERILSEVQDRYKNLVDLSPDAILVDADGEHIFANPAAARLLGARSPGDLVGKKVLDYVLPEDRESVRQRMGQVLAGAVTAPREFHFLRLDGSPIAVEVTGSRVEFGGRLANQVVVRDLTERKKAEEALKRSEERLKRSQEIAHLGSWELDLVAGELTWSDEVYRIFGLQPQEFGATYPAFLDHVHPDDRASVDAAYSGSIAEGRDSYEIEHRVVRQATGEVRWVHEKCAHLRDAQGTIVRSVGMVLDVTERKQVEAALKESEARVRRKLESLPSPEGAVEALELKDIVDAPGIQSLLDDFHALAGIPLAIIDLKGEVLVGQGGRIFCTKFHRVHPETCRNCIESDTVLTTGVPEGEFKLYKCENHMWDVSTPIIVGGKHVGNIFSGQFFFADEEVDRDLFRAQARRYGFEEEAYLAALDSVPRLSREALQTGMGFFTKLAAMLSKESHGTISLARSLAERDALLESLRESEERFRLMFERHNAVMLLIDPRTGAIEDGNMAASRFYGYSRDDLRALRIHDLNQLPAEEVTVEYGKAAAEERNHFEFLHRSVSGETRWVDVHSAPVEARGKQLLFSIIHDITERKLAEAERERLREIEQELSEVLQAQNEELAVQGEELQVQNEELRAAQSQSARLLQEQSSLLLRLQEGLLDIPRELPGVKFGHLYHSATREALVGGDFYDVFGALDGCIGLLIGDVSGHGVEAARIATLAKDTVHAFAHQFRRPHLVLRETNELLVEKNLPGFVTVFLGFLDPGNGTITYSSAGHPPPLVSRDGRIETLQTAGSPLGVFADARYHDIESTIEEGSLLLLYTDGITEARRDGDFYGEARLAEAFGRKRDRPVGDLPPLLLEEALEFSDRTLRDDVALLAVRYLGRGGEEQKEPT